MDRSRPTHTPVCDSVLFCSRFLTSTPTVSLQISTKEELSCQQCSNASIQVLFTEWNCRSEHRKGRLRFLQHRFQDVVTQNNLLPHCCKCKALRTLLFYNEKITILVFYIGHSIKKIWFNAGKYTSFYNDYNFILACTKSHLYVILLFLLTSLVLHFSWRHILC